MGGAAGIASVSVISFSPKAPRLKLLATAVVVSLLVLAGCLVLASATGRARPVDPFQIALLLVALLAGGVVVMVASAVLRILTLEADDAGMQWWSLLGHRQVRWSEVDRVSFSHGGLSLHLRNGRSGILGRADVVAWEDALAVIRSRIPATAHWG